LIKTQRSNYASENPNHPIELDLFWIVVFIGGVTTV